MSLNWYTLLWVVLLTNPLIPIGVVVAAVALIPLIIDACLRLVAPSQTELYPPLSGVKPGAVKWTQPTKLFYFADAFTGAKKSTDAVRSVWCYAGNVLCFGYGTTRFVAKQKVPLLVSKIQYVIDKSPTTRIVLIASGMGAMVAIDVWRQLRKDLMTRDNWSCQVELVVVDGVCGIDNLQGVNPTIVRALKWLPVGPITDRLLGAYQLRRLPKPSIDDVQPDLAIQSVWSETVAEMTRYKLSIRRDVFVYADKHAPIEPATFMGLTRVIYLWSNLEGVTVT